MTRKLPSAASVARDVLGWGETKWPSAQARIIADRKAALELALREVPFEDGESKRRHAFREGVNSFVRTRLAVMLKEIER